MISILGSTFEGGGRELGSKLGPAALRLAGIGSQLMALGIELRDLGDVNPATEDWPEDVGIRNFSKAVSHFRPLKERVAAEINAGNTPLVLGGDHSISIGSISGALEACKGGVAVLWIDAHADANSVKTSPSGNLHGMPLGFLSGLTEPSTGYLGPYWQSCKRPVVERQMEELESLVPQRKLTWNHVAWIGLRDVDPGESDVIRGNPGCFAATMHEIDRFGIPEIIRRFDLWLSSLGVRNLWISLDVDVFDPVFAPGTGTAVRGGLSYREGHLLAELLCENLQREDCAYQLAGLDIVETNPIRDQQNETAKIAVEWALSLFGKTILGGGAR